MNILSTLSYSFFWPAVESLISKEDDTSRWFTTSWSLGSVFGSILLGLFLFLSKRFIFLIMSLISIIVLVISISLRTHGGHGSSSLGIIEILYAIKSKPLAWVQAYMYSFIQGTIFSFYPVIVEYKKFPEIYIIAVISMITFSRTFLFYVHEIIEKYVKNKIYRFFIYPFCRIFIFY